MSGMRFSALFLIFFSAVVSASGAGPMDSSDSANSANSMSGGGPSVHDPTGYCGNMLVSPVRLGASASKRHITLTREGVALWDRRIGAQLHLLYSLTVDELRPGLTTIRNYKGGVLVATPIRLIWISPQDEQARVLPLSSPLVDVKPGLDGAYFVYLCKEHLGVWLPNGDVPGGLPVVSETQLPNPGQIPIVGFAATESHWAGISRISEDRTAGIQIEIASCDLRTAHMLFTGEKWLPILQPPQ